mmetsp:Transcript_2951/g.8783  ORF Transcript_2951/g.8783 Transcript_2951/m.8783 type:complete len:290 (+) Transcript_2951:262-1131(+)
MRARAKDTTGAQHGLSRVHGPPSMHSRTTVLAVHSSTHATQEMQEAGARPEQTTHDERETDREGASASAVGADASRRRAPPAAQYAVVAQRSRPRGVGTGAPSELLRARSSCGGGIASGRRTCPSLCRLGRPKSSLRAVERRRRFSASSSFTRCSRTSTRLLFSSSLPIWVSHRSWYQPLIMLPSSLFSMGIFSSSLWGPSSMMRPLSMTRILLHFLTVARRCAIMMVQPVLLSSIILSKAACTTPSAFESRALVASSSSMIVGLRMMARAMAKRCFWPPLSFTPRSPA